MKPSLWNWILFCWAWVNLAAIIFHPSFWTIWFFVTGTFLYMKSEELNLL